MPSNGKTEQVKPGDTFNHMTVINFSHHDKRWRRHYLCRCRCGTTKTVLGTLLRSGNTKSCGCWAKEAARLRALPHGHASRNQVIAGYRHKAGKLNLAFSLTVEQFSRLVSGPCFYCGIEPSNLHKSGHGTGDFTYNGLDRIDTRKGYIISNVVASCRRCNLSKSNRQQGEFIAWIRRAYLHLSRTAMAAQWGNL